MAARDLARHVDASLCISPASNAAWSVAPNTQPFSLSSDHISITEPYSERLHDFTNYKLLQFNLNLFLASTNYFQSDLMHQLSSKTISQITQTTRMVIWRRSET